VKISVNSKEQAVAPDCSVQSLLHQLGFAEKRVAVEVNQELVTKSQWPELRLKDGDRVEIVSFVGGG
jgi:sulfur carrier protein